MDPIQAKSSRQSRDGTPISGATGSVAEYGSDISYNVPSGLTAAHAGTYRVEISNAAGTTYSPDAVVPWVSESQPWLDSGRVGDIVYFLFPSPGRILRYDLAQNSWLPLVYTNGVKTVTAFLPIASK